MWYHGVLQANLWQIILLTLLLTHVTIVSVTVYLHRYSAHRSLTLHPLLAHFFRFWLWLTTGMITKEWTAVHRKHHARCETQDDPHSPVQRGLATVLWRGAELYQHAATEETLAKYGKGTPDDWLERHLYRHSGAGITLMFVIDLLLFGAIGITVWAIQMIWIPLFAAGVINGVGHAKGYRNFECPDAARNVVPWGILIGGEELHNNHHTYPNSAKLSVKWWEIDIGWVWIRLFKFLRLAEVKPIGPLASRINDKSMVDLDTAWGALNDRFHIMSEYSRKVIVPLIKKEKRAAIDTPKFLLNRARRLLVREPSLRGETDRRDIATLLRQYPSFQHVYEMQVALNDIWKNGASNVVELKSALADWCRQAEESGIDTLRDFAAFIRSYSIPKPATI